MAHKQFELARSPQRHCVALTSAQDWPNSIDHKDNEHFRRHPWPQHLDHITDRCSQCDVLVGESHRKAKLKCNARLVKFPNKSMPFDHSLCWFISIRILTRDIYNRSKKYWIESSIDGSTVPLRESFSSITPCAIVWTTSEWRSRILTRSWQNLHFEKYKFTLNCWSHSL